MSKNPFHRFTTNSGKKVDVNLNHVVSFYPDDAGSGTDLVFGTNDRLTIQESTTSVRNRARKTWPDQTTTTDHVEEN